MVQESTKYMIIIYGPTAVGKTDAAFKIAEHISAEIINADVGQFYTPLLIGTAKPDWKKSPVPHHLFDILDEPKDLTVAQYRELLIPVLDEIWRRNNIPIIVSGSGFYLTYIFFPPEANTIDQQEKVLS